MNSTDLLALWVFIIIFCFKSTHPLISFEARFCIWWMCSYLLGQRFGVSGSFDCGGVTPSKKIILISLKYIKRLPKIMSSLNKNSWFILNSIQTPDISWCESILNKVEKQFWVFCMQCLLNMCWEKMLKYNSIWQDTDASLKI